MATPFHPRSDWSADRGPRSGFSTIVNEGQTGHYGGDSPWGSVNRSSPDAFEASTNHDRCASILRSYRDYHMDVNDWIYLGYNSVTCPHGHRYEGRGVDKRSAAQGTIAGNDRSCATLYIAGEGDPLTYMARIGFLEEASRFGTRMRWDHSDWKSTACAGDPFRAWEAQGFPHPILEEIMAINANAHRIVDKAYQEAGKTGSDGWKEGAWPIKLATSSDPLTVLNEMRDVLELDPVW